MIPISVVIITFNEEKSIGRCLDSVRGIADDLVVVDSFSTDRTADICREMKIRFISHAFEGHIEQKNFAITQALYPHILSLDGDEYLSADLFQSIAAIKSSWVCDGYSMNRLNSYCGRWIRHGSWYPDRKLRLWDSRKGAWGGDNPHDIFSLVPGSSKGHLTGDLLHEAYRNIPEHLEKISRYAVLAAESMRSGGRKFSLLNLMLNPPAAFLKSYLFKAGFLDGVSGLTIALFIAFGTYVKYALLREMNDKKVK